MSQALVIALLMASGRGALADEPKPLNQEVSAARAASLNDWLHGPEWLDLQLKLQAQPLANPSGGTRQGASWMQQLSLDLER